METKNNNIYCRLASIRMVDFKNIEDSTIVFDNTNSENFANNDNYASVTGIYGPNGIGKTTVLLAVEILRNALTGNQIYRDNWVIRAGKERAHLEFNIIAYIEEEKSVSSIYDSITYSFDLINNVTTSFVGLDGTERVRECTGIENETIKYGGYNYKDKESIRQKVLISTDGLYTNNGSRMFGTQIGTKTKVVSEQDKKYAKNDKFYDNLIVFAEDKNNLQTWKEESQKKSESFLFNKKLFDFLIKKLENNDQIIYGALMAFGDNIVVVNDSIKFGLSFADEFKVLDSYEENGKLVNKAERMAFGTRALSMVGIARDEEDEKEITNRINRINKIIKKIVANFEIKIEFAQKTINGREVRAYSLYSLRNDTTKIPLSQESLGIKKIISIVLGVWAVANNKGFTLAVDEIESGIYDVLLCNILKEIYNKGKGQLIFTAHNLSPLDSSKTRKGLDYKCIRFATPNSKDKFIKIPIKGNNNLRDKYIELIVNDPKDKENLDPRLKDLYVGNLDADSLFE